MHSLTLHNVQRGGSVLRAGNVPIFPMANQHQQSRPSLEYLLWVLSLKWPDFRCRVDTMTSVHNLGVIGVKIDAGFLVVYLLVYILATSKIISGWVPPCNSVHSWWLYSAAPPGDQATDTITWYPTQWHYSDTMGTSPCPILIIFSARLGNDKYKFDLIWLDREPNFQSLTPKSCGLPIQPPRPVGHKEVTLFRPPSGRKP